MAQMLKDNRSKREKIAERDRKIRKLYIAIADEAVEIGQISSEMKRIEAEDEAAIMKSCRKIEDCISSIRRKYKEVEKLQYSDIDD